MKKLHVKTGDTVQVIAGKDKGAVGQVIEAFPKEGRIRVQGVNILTKHMKPSQANQQGGIIKVEGKIDSSNALLYCDSCGKGVRTGKQINEEGQKVRVCKACGKVID